MILVVDDEPSWQRSVARLFHGLTLAAPTLGEALDVLAAAPATIDVVLLDVDMHEAKSGVDLIPAFRVVAPGVAVVIVTARLVVADCLRADRLGCLGYVIKGDNRRLRTAVERAINAARAGSVPLPSQELRWAGWCVLFALRVGEHVREAALRSEPQRGLQ